MQNIARHLIQKHGLTDSFYITNMALLNNKITQWKYLLPNVKPFYAMKCNPDREIIKTMIYNNIGFDCASKTEIDTIINTGGQPHNIIFAHPVKKIKELLYASNLGIKYTTFDSKSELDKIAEYTPLMKSIIRLKINNPSARVQLGLKYGVDRSEYKELIDYAMNRNINIDGVSFHVGSASHDPMIFKSAIDYSSEVFSYAKMRGYDMNILDIGGGFTSTTFNETATVLNTSLEIFHKQHSNITVISEPGRYFVEEVFTFYTPVIGQRMRAGVCEYWISDSLYGSFNCILYDGQQPSYKALKLRPEKEEKALIPSILQGSTCDTFDKITSQPILLPPLENGDFIEVQNFGAYTLSAAKDFNGINMSNPKIFYIE